jgi:DNA-binding NarL/FixJ family response regulator
MNPPTDPTDRTNPTPASNAPGPDPWHDTLRGLSELQVAVLQAVALGYTDAQIRKRLSLDAAELRQELLAAQVRLGARTRLETIAKAFRGGWIS